MQSLERREEREVFKEEKNAIMRPTGSTLSLSTLLSKNKWENYKGNGCHSVTLWIKSTAFGVVLFLEIKNHSMTPCFGNAART